MPGIKNVNRTRGRPGDVTAESFADGLRTAVTRGFGTPSAATWTYGYDPSLGRMISRTDPNGNTTTRELDENGNVIATVDPLGRETFAEYNDFNQLEYFVDAEGVPREFEYDATGDLLQVSVLDHDGTTWAVVASEQYHYDDPTHPADITSMTDPRGKVWSYTYDAAGNRTSSTDPLGNQTTWTYTHQGWTRSMVSPRGNAPGGTPAEHETTYTYNAHGDVLTTTNPEDETTTQTYDANRNLVSVVDAEDETTLHDYDAANRRISTTTAAGSSTEASVSFSYYDDGLLRHWENGLGAQWSSTYDSLGRLVMSTDPNGRTTTRRYDPSGNLVQVTQPGGSCAPPMSGCVTYAYNEADQLLATDYSDPTTPDISDITYDDVGRRTSATDGSGSSSWSWDALGRLVSHTDGAGRTTQYVWDPAGNLVEITYPGQTVPVTRRFDDAGRLVSVEDWLGNETTFVYDVDGNLDVTTFPAATANVDTFEYDRADRLVSSTWASGTQTLGSLTYARDSEGMIEAVAPTGLPGGTDIYAYDTRDFLTGVNAQGLAYDAAGNLIRRADGTHQVFDPAQQLCWASASTSSGGCTTPPEDATAVSYDDRGNRTASIPSTGAASEFAYDQADRLVSATVPAYENTAGQYHAVTAARILSTSAPTIGTCDPSPCTRLAPDTPVAVQVAGLGAVPTSGVSSVVLAVHAVDPAADGELDVYRGDQLAPSGASMMFNAGRWASNTVISELAPDGTIAVESSAAVDVSIDVLGWHGMPDTGPGLTFEPVAASRVMSTNPSSGSCTPDPCARLGASVTTTVQVAGQGGVPSSGVAAVAVVAHALNPAGLGYFTLWPTGSTMPGASSMVYDDQFASALLVVPLGTDGKIDLYTLAEADAALEVVGYYTEPGHGSVAHTMKPETVADTRTGAGTCTPSPCSRLTAAATTTMEVAGLGPIPTDGVEAVGVVLHAIDPASAGYLVAWESGQPVPPGSVLSFGSRDLVSGTAIVPVGPDGTISIASSTAVDLFVEVVAWYDEPTATWHYEYDGDGLRTAKTAPDASVSEFSWDRSGGLPLLLGEHSSAGDVWLIYGPGRVPIAQINADDTVLWYHQDQVGSTRMLTDDSGAVAGTYTYDAYGELAASTGTAEPLLGYAGDYTDDETGFTYLRARYYDPATAQFLTRDPLEAITREAYTYAHNNPVNYRDPTGLCGILGDGPCTPGGIAGDVAGRADDAWDATGGAVVAEVADIDLGSVDWGTSAAGLFNVGYGGWKIGTGIPFFAAGLVGTAVAGPFGIPPLLFGSYQLATGAARTGKGLGQFAVGVTRRVDCEDDQSLGSNAGRFGSGILPGPVNSLWDLLAGLP